MKLKQVKVYNNYDYIIPSVQNCLLYIVYLFLSQTIIFLSNKYQYSARTFCNIYYFIYSRTDRYATNM